MSNNPNIEEFSHQSTVLEPKNQDRKAFEQQNTILDSQKVSNFKFALKFPDELRSRYEMIQEIADAGQSFVYLVNDKDTNQQVILKIHKLGSNPKQDIFNQLKLINADYIVKPLDYQAISSLGLYYETLEYIPLGSLRDLIKKSYQFNYNVIFNFIDQMNSAFNELYNQYNIIHRDIKPDNILIRNENPLKIALVDFGISSMSEMTYHQTTLHRTTSYAPPEVFSGVLYKNAWDYWSLGMILFELIQGESYFPNTVSEAVISMTLMTKDIDLTKVSPDYQLLLRGLLTRDPAQRWNFDQVSKWLKGDRNIPVALSQMIDNNKKSYQLEDINCYNLNDLAKAMAQNWETAKFDLKDEKLLIKWIEENAEANDYRFTKQLIQNNNLTLDQKVLAFIGKYAPELPLIWKSQVLNQDNLLILCHQALKQDKNSQNLILEIHQQQLFDFYAQYSKSQIYADWHSKLIETIKTYEHLWTLLPADLKTKKPDFNMVLPMIIQLVIGTTQFDIQFDENIKIIEIIQTFFKQSNSHAKTLIAYLFQNEFKTICQNHTFNHVIYKNLDNLNRAKEQDRIARTFNGKEYKTINEANQAKEQDRIARTFNGTEYKTINEANQAREKDRIARTFKGIEYKTIDEATKAKDLFDRTVNGKEYKTIEDAQIARKFITSISNKNILTGHSSAIWSVSYSPCGQFIASGSSDNTIKIWSVSNGRCIKTLTGHSTSIYSVSYSPCGQFIASGSSDNTIKIWSISNGSYVKTLIGHSDCVRSVSYSPCGQFLASGSSDRTVKIWSVSDSHCLNNLEEHINWINSVSYSPCGKYIASGSNDKTIKIWSVSDERCVKTLTGHSNWVNSVSYSPCGQFIASGSDDKTVKIWSIFRGHCVKTLTGHSDCVRSVSYSPCGQFIASGSDDKTVKIWSVFRGHCIKTLTGHSDCVRSVSYSPCGQFITSGSNDKIVRIWLLVAENQFTENPFIVDGVEYNHFPDAEQARLEFKKKEADRIARTFNNIEYKTIEEANQAREVDRLERLSRSFNGIEYKTIDEMNQAKEKDRIARTFNKVEYKTIDEANKAKEKDRIARTFKGVEYKTIEETYRAIKTDQIARTFNDVEYDSIDERNQAEDIFNRTVDGKLYPTLEKAEKARNTSKWFRWLI